MRRDLFDAFHLFEQQEIKDRFRLALNGENSLLARFPLTCMEVFEGLPLPELQEKYVRVMSEYSVLACHPQLPKSRAWYDRVWSKLRLDDIRHDYFLANQIEDTDANRNDYQTAMQLHREILADLGWLGRPVHEQSFNEDNTQKQPRLTKNVIERMAMIPPDENHEFVKDTPWTVEGKDISFIYRRAAPLKPAWTVMAYGGGGTYGYHYERSRAQLTLRERARIQTFTDDFVFMSSKVRAQIGEAVPPLMGKHIAQNIIHTLEMISTKSAQQVELAVLE
jgi:DNA (cytosine-5)-methyltransferase 1